MKETLLKIPLFAAALAVLYVGFYILYNLYGLVVPTRDGLIFSSALSLGLLPSATLALLVALNSLHHHPGKPLLSVLISLVCFFAALNLSFAFQHQISPVQPIRGGMVSGQLFAQGGKALYTGDSTGEGGERFFNLVIKKDRDASLAHFPWASYDPMNSQFLFPDGTEAFPVPVDTQESAYFAPPEVLRGIFGDINYIHQYLEKAWSQDFNRFMLLSLILTALFGGLMIFMHIKVWPLIKWSLLLVALRLVFLFLRFSFHDAVYIASQWTTDEMLLDALPLVISALGGLFLLNIALFRLPFRKGET